MLAGILLAVASMVGWGLADFIAALASKKNGTLKTFAWIQICGLITLLILAPWFYEQPSWSPAQYFLGLGGVFLFTGMYFLLYQGYEKGLVTVVSPIFSAYVLVIILIGVFFFREHLSGYQKIAVTLLVVGIFLSSADLRQTALAIKGRMTGGILEAFGGMILAGMFFTILAIMARQVGWFSPFLIIRAGSVVLILLTIWYSRGNLILESTDLKWVVLAGILDSLAFLAYNQSQRIAPLAIVGSIGGSFSFITVLLALAILRERPVLNQWLGIFAILGGIFLLGSG